jgi:hypothetical protein
MFVLPLKVVCTTLAMWHQKGPAPAPGQETVGRGVGRKPENQPPSHWNLCMTSSS